MKNHEEQEKLKKLERDRKDCNRYNDDSEAFGVVVFTIICFLVSIMATIIKSFGFISSISWWVVWAPVWAPVLLLAILLLLTKAFNDGSNNNENKETKA